MNLKCIERQSEARSKFGRVAYGESRHIPKVKLQSTRPVKEKMLMIPLVHNLPPSSVKACAID